jgi:hypothetical protein
MRPPKPSIQAHLEILVSGIILLHHLVVSCIWMHLECRHQHIKQYFGLAKNCNFRQFWMQAQRISNSQYSIASRPLRCSLRCTSHVSVLPTTETVQGITRCLIHVENGSRNSLVSLCVTCVISYNFSFGIVRIFSLVMHGASSVAKGEELWSSSLCDATGYLAHMFASVSRGV